MSQDASEQELPEFKQPPVTEIVGAIQFLALPHLNLPDILRIGQELDGYKLQDLQPQLPPIYEPPPGQAAPVSFPQLFFGPVQQAQRALYGAHDQRFVAQLQRDRIAINERRIGDEDEAPSSKHVWPRLASLRDVVASAFTEEGSLGPEQPTVIELTYVNTIRPAAGVWESHADVHRVLRVVAHPAGDVPYDAPEGVSLGLSYPLLAADGSFQGRLHLAAQPTYDPAGTPMLQLMLISRRTMGETSEPVADAFEACHRAAVMAFVAATTPQMHTIWGRIK